MATRIINNKFIKYCITASIVSLLNILIYYLFYNFVIDSVLLSNTVAYTVSITLNFIFNKKVVFKCNNQKLFKEIILFLFVKLIAFFIDSGVLILCKDVFGISNLISKLISNCSTTISNYILNKHLVFKDNNKKKKEEDIIIY